MADPNQQQLVTDEYQKQFGRAPTGSEMASELDNLTKYGWDTGPYGGVQAQIDKRATNDPGSGYAPLPGQGGGGGTGGSGGSGGSSGGGGGTNYGSPGPSITTYPRDGGAGATGAMMDEITAALKNINAQPDVNVNAIDPGSIPEFTVPGEDLSPAVDNTLMDLMEGQDPFGMTGVLKGMLGKASAATAGQDDTTQRIKSALDAPDPLAGKFDALLTPNDPLGLQTRLQSLLDSTAGGGVNSGRLQKRLEGARENLTQGESSALADMRGSLADRGLISTPGAPQGLELDSTSRAFEPLQRSYLDEVRQANTDESKLADDAQFQALGDAMNWDQQTRDAMRANLGLASVHQQDVNQTKQGQLTLLSAQDQAAQQHELETVAAATGWSKDQIDRRLSAAKTADERQQMLSDIAIQSLNSNMEWNKFLANFGLQREQVAEQIRQGRIAQIQPLLSMFEALIGQSRSGYVG